MDGRSIGFRVCFSVHLVLLIVEMQNQDGCPFIDHITSSREVDMKEGGFGRIVNGFDDLFSYWFFVSPSPLKSICYANPFVSNGIFF